jgi:CheY-like chemotaxis protein
MNSTKGLLHRINNPSLSPDERATLRCELAKRFEQLWNFEAAREALGDLWQRVGDRPALEGLQDRTKGEVLLRAGALTGWIGSLRQIQDAQELAKNLITESIAYFESLKLSEKVSEAQIEIAYCYWRQGAFDEARVLLQEALARSANLEIEVRAIGVLRSAIVEESAKRLHECLHICTDNAELFEQLSNTALKGKFHNEFGMVLKDLGVAEQRHDYVDRALIEFAAASFYFEEAKLSRHQACVENNLGFLYGMIRKFTEAHEHLDRAQAIFTSLRDLVHIAQVDETRARVMLEEGRIADAEKLIQRAAHVLEQGGEQSLLSEALITHGIALSRLNVREEAHATLDRAIDVAERAGDLDSAGAAALTLIEELGPHIANDELCATVERAQTLLQNAQDTSTLRRLAHCASQALFLVSAYPVQIDWKKFSWKELMVRYEPHFIELALRDAGGSVTQAAHLLGFKHHQSLSTLLQKRHKNLLHARTAIVPRKRRLIGEQDSDQDTSRLDKPERSIRILHIEDDEMVAAMAKEMLEIQGWQVETCADGNAALTKISGDADYDLLLVDYDLPGVNGLELVSRARKLAHRSRTLIIVLSATPIEAAALKAGADEFLQKPQAVSSLVKTISRLLHEGEQEEEGI